MQRLIIKQLSAWKDDPKRKPLILQGIRQCGKTWVLKEFGRTHYRKLVYLSFDQHPEYHIACAGSLIGKCRLNHPAPSSGQSAPAPPVQIPPLPQVGAAFAHFAKHLSSSMTQKVTAIWQSLPAQLAKENKRFQYNIIKSGANVRDYGEALAWLIDAHMSYRVARIKYPGLPISAHEDAAAFKLFAADIGLLRRLSALDTSVFSLGSSLFTEFKGAFTENFILQSLTATFKSPLRYWSMTNPNYEVDFILQHGMSIIPIEVKSGFDSRGRGLAAYQKRYQARESQDRQHPSLRVRYSLLNLNLTDDLLNIPLFLVDQTPSLLEKCL